MWTEKSCSAWAIVHRRSRSECWISSGVLIRGAAVSGDWSRKICGSSQGVAPNSIARQERGEMGIREPLARLVRLMANQIMAEKEGKRRGKKS